MIDQFWPVWAILWMAWGSWSWGWGMLRFIDQGVNWVDYAFLFLQKRYRLSGNLYVIYLIGIRHR